MEYDVVIIWYGNNVCSGKSICSRQKWCVRRQGNAKALVALALSHGARGVP